MFGFLINAAVTERFARFAARRIPNRVVRLVVVSSITAVLPVLFARRSSARRSN